MVDLHRSSALDWKPSPVVALSTSTDHSQVAAAREDGSLEVWLVSPGSVGWHHQLTIHGDPNYRVSSLLWCHCGINATPSKRLFSSGIDGSVFEWDLFELKQKVVLHSIGVSIWQMAAPPDEERPNHVVNGFINGGGIANETNSDSSDSDGDDNGDRSGWPDEGLCIAMGCDDGCIRLYHVSLSNSWNCHGASPRVGGRILSVAWSGDSKTIYAGSSDGAIRCWNRELSREIHRITVGSGRPGPELCVWSLVALRCGTLVSADSTGSVQFWDTLHGTLLQSYSYHRGDANVLAVSPNHKRVFSAGSDGQVILYKRSSGSDEVVTRQWSYIGYVRAHTHDVHALTVAVPIIHVPLADGERAPKRNRRTKKKPARDYSYHKWAHAGVPMLVSGGDDTKMFAYSVNDFTKFSPHDICPAPQRVPVHLVLGTPVAGDALLLAQCRDSLDVYAVRASGLSSSTLELFTRVKSRRSSGGILCSAISASGTSFAYSDRSRPSLFGLEEPTPGKRSVVKRRLPRGIPSAHCMAFGAGGHLFLSGHDRRIYVVGVESLAVVTTFTPCRDVAGEEEPPITKMVCSWDGQWLAAVNCSGDIYVFSLELQRQHWFVSRLDGAAVTAVGFPPQSGEALIVTTSSNQVYSLDVEAKQLGEWSMRNASALPRRYREFPGEVIGLSFVPCSESPAAIIYSASAMCVVDFTMPVVDVADPVETNGGLKRKLLQNRKNFEFIVFRDPVLFVGYLSDKSVLIVDKKWIDVVSSLDTLPVHRHIYGT